MDKTQSNKNQTVSDAKLFSPKGSIMSLTTAHQIGHKIVHHLHQDFETVRGQLGSFKSSLHLHGLMHGSTGALGHLRHDLLLGSATLVLLAVLSQAPEAKAAPMGGTVVGGAATITQYNGGATTVVRQSTNKAVINWESFNLAANEGISFSGPSGDSVILNRVLDSKPSTIAGQIWGNATVFIVNPNGIVFSASSNTFANNLVISTADISALSFMNATPNLATLAPTTGTIDMLGTFGASKSINVIGKTVNVQGPVTTYSYGDATISLRATGDLTLSSPEGVTWGIRAMSYGWSGGKNVNLSLKAGNNLTIASNYYIATTTISSSGGDSNLSISAGGNIVNQGQVTMDRNSSDGIRNLSISSGGDFTFDAASYLTDNDITMNIGGNLHMIGSANYGNLSINSSGNITQDANSSLNLGRVTLSSGRGISMIGNNTIAAIDSITNTGEGHVTIRATGTVELGGNLNNQFGNIDITATNFALNGGNVSISSGQDLTINGNVTYGASTKTGGVTLNLSGQSHTINGLIKR